MRKLAGIIESPVAPPTNMLWICENEIKCFSRGLWVTLGPVPRKQKQKPNLYDEYIKQGGKLSLKEFAKELATLIG